MKIAVTYENGEVFQHFGHTSEFKIYTVEDNKDAYKFKRKRSWCFSRTSWR